MGLSHEIDFKNFNKIYRTRLKKATRLVFKFLRGSDDFVVKNCSLLIFVILANHKWSLIVH
jgi:hypothetical protein